MANLQATTVTGVLTINGNTVHGSNSDVSPWYKLSIPLNTDAYVHVRTPMPADTSALGWNPSILEVVGYHDYTSNIIYDFMALLNVNGGNNDWYGSQIMRNDGTVSPLWVPFVYRSSNTYGGVTRVCFSVGKNTLSRNGYLWVRWFNSSAQWTSYAWAITNSSSSSAVY